LRQEIVGTSRILTYSRLLKPIRVAPAGADES